ncbi:unnamed protein product [Parajaminaea phylloscopi]
MARDRSPPAPVGAHIHAGRPELTGRAVLVGLVVGSLLCFTNCYFGLQSSWISMSSLQSALVGYGIVKLLPRTADRVSLGRTGGEAEDGRGFWRWFGQGRFTPQENVVLQATAVALGSMPLTAGLIGVVPALAQLNPRKDHGAEAINLQGSSLLLWSAALAFFGVFFAGPLRKRVIVTEKLTFPSGTATAHLISVLHDSKLREEGSMAATSASDAGGVDGSASIRRRRSENGREHETSPLLGVADEQDRSASNAEAASPASWESWKALIWSFAASSGFTFASALFPALYALPVFDVLPPHNLAARWGWYFTPSLSYIGQGVIMGIHTTASMMLGALFGWALLAPLAHHRGWTDGPPMDAENGSKAWILWISLAIMTAESFVGLAVILVTSLRSPSSGMSSGASADADEDEPPSRLPPTPVVVSGLIASSLLAIVGLWALFGREGIEPYTTAIAIALAFALSVLAVRALGTTDLNPVAALGKISQLVFALLQPHNIAANMIAGGLSEAGAMQAGELMQDFKTGHLTHASPRSQFYGQIMGSVAGIFVSSFAYQLYVKTYDIPSASFPAPAASMWLNFARLVNNGEIPRHSKEWMLGCGLIFAVSGTIKAVAQAKKLRRSTVGGSPSRWEEWAWYLPSGVAFAVGILNTPNFSIARFLGGLITLWWERRQRQRGNGEARSGSGAKILLIIIASGFVLGEGAGSILNLFAKQGGMRPISCAGCRGSCGGGC